MIKFYKEQPQMFSMSDVLRYEITNGNFDKVKNLIEEGIIDEDKKYSYFAWPMEESVSWDNQIYRYLINESANQHLLIKISYKKYVDFNLLKSIKRRRSKSEGENIDKEFMSSTEITIVIPVFMMTHSDPYDKISISFSRAALRAKEWQNSISGPEEDWVPFLP